MSGEKSDLEAEGSLLLLCGLQRPLEEGRGGRGRRHDGVEGVSDFGRCGLGGPERENVDK